MNDVLVIDPEESRTRVRASSRAVIRERLKPPPDLTGSEWADRYRHLSPESASEPGPWRTDRAPYTREIMDACTDPTIQRVVWMAASQVAKTECINNTTGYYIHQDASPMLVIQPTLQAAAEWSKDRLAPMFRDSPALRGILASPRSRDSGNTILHKAFPGGRLSIVGANSPSGLSAKPIRIVLADELDRMPVSAGGQGDPVSMGIQRTRTFWNRKIILISTPTIKDVSRIEREWKRSDQRKYFVPCPHCDHYQVLVWSGLKWDTNEVDGERIAHPATAQYACEECGVLIEERYKLWMLRRGEWRAQRPGRPIAGFHISALYSMFAPWEDLVSEFLEKRSDPNEFMTFVNFVLGEPWEESNEEVSERDIQARAEIYSDDDHVAVPNGVGVLTAAVDVQDDRLELLVRGFGAREESWQILHERIQGDPEKPDVWARLDALLLQPYRHASGLEMRIRACAIDSGHLATEVYRFVAARQGRGVWALKGMDSRASEPLKRAKKKNRYGVKLWSANTHLFKWQIYRRLKIRAPVDEVASRPRPGFLHYRRGRWGPDGEFFEQLGAEVPARKRQSGQTVIYWKQIRERNEAFDLEVYALVALHMLGEGVRGHLADLADQARRGEGVHLAGSPPKRRRVISSGVSA